MATWKQFTDDAPDLAAQIQARFEAAETHLLATLRMDGSPRVSGSEVAFVGEDLTFGSMPGARKARDLQRDGRSAIHAQPSAGGDAKVAGVAVEVTGQGKASFVKDGEPPGEFHAFRLDVREAVMTSVEDGELVIRLWRPGRAVQVFRRT